MMLQAALQLAVLRNQRTLYHIVHLLWCGVTGNDLIYKEGGVVGHE